VSYWVEYLSSWVILHIYRWKSVETRSTNGLNKVKIFLPLLPGDRNTTHYKNFASVHKNYGPNPKVKTHFLFALDCVNNCAD
jgi:hypothetical protein